MLRRPPRSTLFPSRRSSDLSESWAARSSAGKAEESATFPRATQTLRNRPRRLARSIGVRSEEHTSELQSQFHLVCRLLLEKKKNKVVNDPQEPTVRMSRGS